MSGARQTIVTTAAIQAGMALQDTCGQQCVDWAIGLLAEGRDSEHLAMLAGQLPPFNHFEIAALRDRVLTELAIPEINGDAAVLAYAVEQVRFALQGRADMAETFVLLTDLYEAAGHPRELSDLYRLHLAHCDLETYDSQYYWTDATCENIASIMRERAEKFVRDYDAKSW